MKTAKFLIPKEFYEKIPAEERVLFLTMGHVANELMALRKLILLSDYSIGGSNLEKEGQATQTLMLIKLFSLKAHEGYQFLRKQSKITRIISESVMNLAKPLKSLNVYFGMSNIISQIRNKLVAHYDTENILKLADDIPDGGLYIYLSEQVGLSLYSVSEEVFLKAIGEVSSQQKPLEDIISNLLDDVDNVAGWLAECTQYIFIYIGKNI